MLLRRPIYQRIRVAFLLSSIPNWAQWFPSGGETFKRRFSPSISSTSSCSQLTQATVLPTSVLVSLFSMTYSKIGLNWQKLNIHYELLFYKATWDRFASGLEVEKVPVAPNGCYLVTLKTSGDLARGHVWVLWGNLSLGSGGWGMRIGMERATFHFMWPLVF